MFLNDMALQAVFGDGGIAALGTVMQMLPCMCPHMRVIVDLVPIQLTC